MKFVMDRNIRAAAETFDRLGEVVRLDGRAIARGDLAHADTLIVRSVTRVDAALLEGTPVRFVGTTTIGTDHLDIPWLERNGIAWASAPGCNADAAAQYTLAMAWLASERLGRELKGMRAGIVGCGNVGSRVRRLFHALGLETVANDPPLEDAGQGGFVSLGEALDSDIVCLHTPLTRSGPHPTHHLIDADALAQMRPGALLVNAGRGDVIDGDALLRALQSSPDPCRPGCLARRTGVHTRFAGSRHGRHTARRRLQRRRKTQRNLDGLSGLLRVCRPGGGNTATTGFFGTRTGRPGRTCGNPSRAGRGVFRGTP